MLKRRSTTSAVSITDQEEPMKKPEMTEMSTSDLIEATLAADEANELEATLSELSLSSLSLSPLSPGAVAESEMSYFVPCPHHGSWKSDWCATCVMGGWVGMAAFLQAGGKWSTLAWQTQYVVEAALRSWMSCGGPFSAEMYQATVIALYAGFDGTEQMTASDIECRECDIWVGKFHFEHKEHYSMVCADCGQHEGHCSMCPNCDNHRSDCSCCPTCGDDAYYGCSCCSYCEMAPNDCECETCGDCGSIECGCGSQPFKFGTSRDVPWSLNSAAYAPMSDVPDPSEIDKSVDPVQSAADYYLLDALVNNVRFAQATGATRGGMSEMTEAGRNDTIYAACTNAAKAHRNRLIERLDRTFLAYTIAAIGGELRYHRACAADWAPRERSSAWDAFTPIVREKGAKVLFDAIDLFEEFAESAYGGPKWAQIAKVTAQRLSGKMAPWLFVDRIFTLEHNGGCVLNKVEWDRKNTLGYGMYEMRKVLDAHASSDTDWNLLLGVASPEVRDMFLMADRRAKAIVGRFGGVLAPVSPKRKKGRDVPCGACGYYGCICGNDVF